MSSNAASNPDLSLNLHHDHVQDGKINLLQTMSSRAILLICILQEGKLRLLQCLHCKAIVLGSMSAAAACK